MKKLHTLLSTTTICLLLILASCSKQDAIIPLPFVKTIKQRFVDTPYLKNATGIRFADTPYLKPIIVSTVVADTPYLKTIVISSVIADTPYLQIPIPAKSKK